MTTTVRAFSATQADLADGTAWTNIGNVGADDGTPATCRPAGAGFTATLRATNFGFSIPAGATIIGVLAEVEAKSDFADDVENSIKWVVGGSDAASLELSDFSALPAAYSVRSFGSLALPDLFGNGNATPAILNAADFGVQVQYSTADALRFIYVDYIAITVGYQGPRGGRLLRMR